MAESVHVIAMKATADFSDAEREFLSLSSKIKQLEKSQKQFEAGSRRSARIDNLISGLKRQRDAIQGLGTAHKSSAVAANVATAAVKKNTISAGSMGQAYANAGFAVEDFFAGFETGGIKGGLRGAGNNIGVIARVLGGPFLGALVGITAVALPLLISQLTKGAKKAEDFGKALDKLVDAQNRRVDAFNTGIDNQTRINDIKDEELNLEKLNKDIEDNAKAQKKLNNELKENIILRKGLAAAGGIDPRDFGFAGGLQDLFEEIDTTSFFGVLDSKTTKELGDNAKVKLQEALDVAIQGYQDNPDNAVAIGKVLSKQFNDAIDDAIAETPGASLLDVGALKSVKFSLGFDSVLDDSLDILANVEKLTAIQEKARKLGMENRDTQGELTQLVKEEEALKNKIALATARDLAAKQKIVDLAKKEMDIAQKVLEVANQNPLEQRIQSIVTKFENLDKAFELSSTSPEAQDLLLGAKETLLTSRISELTGILKTTSTAIGGSVRGNNLAGSVRMANAMADAMMQATEDDSNRNPDVVAELRILKQALIDRTLLAVPSL